MENKNQSLSEWWADYKQKIQEVIDTKKIKKENDEIVQN